MVYINRYICIKTNTYIYNYVFVFLHMYIPFITKDLRLINKPMTSSRDEHHARFICKALAQSGTTRYGRLASTHARARSRKAVWRRVNKQR